MYQIFHGNIARILKLYNVRGIVVKQVGIY